MGVIYLSTYDFSFISVPDGSNDHEYRLHVRFSTYSVHVPTENTLFPLQFKSPYETRGEVQTRPEGSSVMDWSTGRMNPGHQTRPFRLSYTDLRGHRP